MVSRQLRKCLQEASALNAAQLAFVATKSNGGAPGHGFTRGNRDMFAKTANISGWFQQDARKAQMTPEAQRIAIAEACGWKFFCVNSLGGMVWHHPSGAVGGIDAHKVDYFIPDYLEDLNAIHEAIATLTDEEYDYFLAHLGGLVLPTHGTYFSRMMHEASAAHRAQAFLMAKGRWEA